MDTRAKIILGVLLASIILAPAPHHPGDAVLSKLTPDQRSAAREIIQSIRSKPRDEWPKFIADFQRVIGLSPTGQLDETTHYAAAVLGGPSVASILKR